MCTNCRLGLLLGLRVCGSIRIFRVESLGGRSIGRSGIVWGGLVGWKTEAVEIRDGKNPRSRNGGETWGTQPPLVTKENGKADLTAFPCKSSQFYAATRSSLC